MVSLVSLWLPILLATVLLFVASFVIHTVLPYHKSDYKTIPGEESLLEAIRSMNLSPGQYVFPRAMSPEAWKEEGAKEALQRGPVGFLHLQRPGPPNMGKMLPLQFLYFLFVIFTAAYVTSRTIPAGGDYLAVFRIVGTVGFLAFSAAEIPGAIWLGRGWSSTWKYVFDGLIYGSLAAGVFGWLWP